MISQLIAWGVSREMDLISPTESTHSTSAKYSTEYIDDGPNLVDQVISHLEEDVAPKIITKRANSTFSGRSPMPGNPTQPEELEEGIFLDLLDNLIYLGDAKAGGNIHGTLNLKLLTIQNRSKQWN